MERFPAILPHLSLTAPAAPRDKLERPNYPATPILTPTAHRVSWRITVTHPPVLASLTPPLPWGKWGGGSLLPAQTILAPHAPRGKMGDPSYPLTPIAAPSAPRGILGIPGNYPQLS